MDIIANLLAARDQAVAIHDWALVSEIESSLARNGYGPPVFETAVAPIERAVPSKRKRR